ncbi:MAG TPA: hypothetical protein VGO89_12115 [Streptomyces sp.]|jgi:hypothetical protein|nr:hypothetical protein [Streptomyces sp.]
MHRSRNIRRGLVVAAAAAGLLALGAGGAQAQEIPGAPSLGKTAGKSVGKTAGETLGGLADVTRGAARQVGHIDKQGAQEVRELEEGGRQGAGKAVGHATKEARKAVRKAPSAPTHQDLGAVSGIPAPAAAPSAPGLPEDLVIEIPELVPGIPSIGILPSSIPALPVTPTIPII